MLRRPPLCGGSGKADGSGWSARSAWGAGGGEAQLELPSGGGRFEDRMRSKHPGIAASICITRSVAHCCNAQTETGNVNAFVESCQDGRRHVLAMITRRRKAK
jgi:hypothetical protein